MPSMSSPYSLRGSRNYTSGTWSAAAGSDDFPWFGEVFQWVGGGPAAPPLLAQRRDGTWTGAAEEVDQLMWQDWGPIFARYAAHGAPNFEAFKARFGGYVKRCPMGLEPLTVADLRRTLGRMRSHSAGGRDGWRIAEHPENASFVSQNTI